MGREFYKVSGSGNDFVAFAGSPGVATPLPPDEAVRALCRRGTGVGADGVMVLQPTEGADYQLIHYNADGSRAELCGNASLCSVKLALELGWTGPGPVRFETDSGTVAGRMNEGRPEIDLAPVREVAPDRSDLFDGHPDEERIGFARVGVPHVVVRCTDARSVDLEQRAPRLRHHASLRDGANVNYVSPGEGIGRWVLRTYERGVEAETLACGTGSVASAMLLGRWSGSDPTAAGERTAPVELQTRSGELLRVSFRRQAGEAEESWIPSLSGSARIVYRGELGEGDWGVW